MRRLRGQFLAVAVGGLVLALHLVATAPATTTAKSSAALSTRCSEPPSTGLTPGVSWGLIGDGTSATSAELAAGVSVKVVRVSWKDFEPEQGAFSSGYLDAKRAEICSLRSQGMKVILDLGIQDTPQWIHQLPNSYLVNQYGESWTASTDPNQTVDNSDANLIFNPALRALAASYIHTVAQTLGEGTSAIRIGGGRDNELGYPVANTPQHSNTYWAYDALAQSQSPVPGWKPGEPSPNGQATRFLGWYLRSLTNYEQWQITTLRASYPGPLILLLPSWGLRPGQFNAAIADNLNGSTSAEINGEVQRGHDFASQVAAITQPNIWIETTWLDSPYGHDTSTDASQWSPVHYLAALTQTNPLHPALWGENTGGGTATTMTYTAQQATKYHLTGVIWYREQQLLSGKYATLPQYKQTIAGRR